VTPGVALGARLRRHREQRGISLRSVADTTKIAHPLLEALERGDVSQWPAGIYRAGFIRAYAAAVGLPPDETAAEFARAFDPVPEPEPAPPAGSEPASSLRLTLARRQYPTFSPERAKVAALDACIVLAAALFVSLPAGFTLSMAIACCALAYYAGSTVWQGRTPAAAWLRYDVAGIGPRDSQRSQAAKAATADAAALPLAFDAARDPIPVKLERRSGTERRRRSARLEPRHRQVDGRIGTTPGIPAVH
jgi:transcriptional regulator with XRE-family HTH domain